MDDDVLDERRLQHHGAPVEAQCAVGSAAAPPLSLVADKYLRSFSPPQSGPPPLDGVPQPHGSASPVPRDEGAADRLVARIAVEVPRYANAEPPVVEGAPPAGARL